MVVAASVRGATHEDRGVPNQDAVARRLDDGVDARLVVALSDGHGSARSFRSDVGAQIAVDTAARLCWRDEVRPWATDLGLLARGIVDDWRIAASPSM